MSAVLVVQMDNGNTVFERKEIKYILTKQQHDELLSALEGRMRPDKYGCTTICNIFFDTRTFRLIRESVEKPKYKEKLRLRTYGVPDDMTPAYIELKKKLFGIVYKRRETVPYKEAMDFLVRRLRPSRWSQIFKEIDWTLDHYEELKPMMALFYERTAYECINDPDVRLTIDSDMRYRLEDVDVSHGSYGYPILDEEAYILEIKILNAMPLWLTKIFDDLKIYPTSFSKCGRAYNKALIEGRIL